MARPQKSQWDAGELFPTEQIRKVLSVGELTGSIRRTLEKEIGLVWVSGEISNLRIQSSGHVYFSIKDATAQLSCVLFRAEAQEAQAAYLQDGQTVILHGQITVYEVRGQYQLRVLSLELRGVGALQAAFERLKQKLNSEGLFDAKRKRFLPRFPSRIGLVTSATGAAIRDVLHVLKRRAPCLDLVLASCRVQGAGATAEIACCIGWLNEFSSSSPDRKLDLILVTRGGGSLEDLWAFNDESVARAIFNSRLPVVSAIGHEIDFTIADFVADLRAATPSAAAEIISEGFFASRQFVQESLAQLRLHIDEHLSWKYQALLSLSHRLLQLHPRRRLQDRSLQLDDLQYTLSRSLLRHYRDRQIHLNQLIQRFLRIQIRRHLTIQQHALSSTLSTLHSVATARLNQHRRALLSAGDRLRLLSPTNTLARGYTMTFDARTGAILRDPSSVFPGQEILTRLERGLLRSAVLDGDPKHEVSEQKE